MRRDGMKLRNLHQRAQELSRELSALQAEISDHLKELEDRRYIRVITDEDDEEGT